MAVSITVANDVRDFSYNPFSHRTQGSIDAIRDHVSSMGRYLGDRAARLVSKVTDKVDEFFSRDNLEYERDLYNQSGRVDDILRACYDLESIARANPVQQRWIMANPNLRKLYNRQLIHGYQETYVDTEPDVLGEDHKDYRLAVNGIMRSDENGYDLIEWFFDEVDVDDAILSVNEQFDIMDSWETTDLILKYSDVDPTSVNYDTRGYF